MTQTVKYLFGFTAASLRLNEMIKIEMFARENGLNNYNSPEIKDLIGHGNLRTAEREFNEIAKRLEKLTDFEKDILLNADHSSQKQVAFLGVCKQYAYIRDFTMEVVREKIQVYNYQLSEFDYLIFVRRKKESHPELERLAETTQKKVKQLVFKILEQAGIIDNIINIAIQPQIVSTELINAILEDNAEWLKMFLFGDNEITELKRIHGNHS